MHDGAGAASGIGNSRVPFQGRLFGNGSIRELDGMMKIDLTGKNALVCGCTSGIGKATASVLAEAGANLVLMGRSEERLRDVLAALDTTSGQRHCHLVADFFEPEAVTQTLHAHLAGGEPVHVLVNNTGGPSTGPLLEKTPDDFMRFLTSHLIIAHLLAQRVVPGMREAGYGRILNVTSNAAKQPLPNMGLSNSIRAAVGNWAKTLATELGPDGITVNNVLPGATDTRELRQVIAGKAKASGKSEAEIIEHMYSLCPVRRFADPAEIAWCIAFLASPLAGYINGINLVVDGGKTQSL
jgi:3-oxoacyl-[acyl-carrier protein] reductase